MKIRTSLMDRNRCLLAKRSKLDAFCLKRLFDWVRIMFFGQINRIQNNFPKCISGIVVVVVVRNANRNSTQNSFKEFTNYFEISLINSSIFPKIYFDFFSHFYSFYLLHFLFFQNFLWLISSSLVSHFFFEAIITFFYNLFIEIK